MTIIILESKITVVHLKIKNHPKNFRVIFYISIIHLGLYIVTDNYSIKLNFKLTFIYTFYKHLFFIQYKYIKRLNILILNNQIYLKIYL